MNRRRFLQTGAAALALSRLPALRRGIRRPEEARRPDRLRLVRQVRPLPADPGRAGRGRLALRRRQEDAGRGRRDGRHAAGLEEEAAHLRRLPRDAQGEGPRHRPDRHARPLARPADDRRRARPGPTSTCQKPISVDVVEGQAMLAAARKHKRVVQVGTQRRSTPHLIEARDTDHQGGQARQDRPASRSTATTTCAPASNPPDTAPPEYLDYEMWTGPAPMRPYNELVHPRGWRAFMEYGNGIVGDMCIHMLDMVRWMLGPRLAAARSAPPAASSCDKASKANITDTQTRHVRLRRPEGRLDAPHLGRRRPTRSIRGRATFYGDKGTLKASVNELRLHPAGRRRRRSTRTSLTSWSSTPRTRPRRTWRSTSPRRSAGT